MRSLGPRIFEQLAADQPDLNNVGLERANNVIPGLTGYKAMPGFSALTSGGISERVIGAVGVRHAENDLPYTYAGTASALYQVQSGAWVDSSGGATFSSDRRWEFVQWGNFVYATNGVDPVQVIEIGAADFGDGISTPLPPKGRHIAIVRNFLVMGNITEGDTSEIVTNRVQWSGLNEPDYWTFDPTRLSDEQDLRGNGGAVQAIVGGTEGLIFQERAIWRMRFVGAPIIFRFDAVETDIGTIAPGSVKRFGNSVYFLARDGFRVIDMSSGQSRLIGEERIDELVLGELDQSNLESVSCETWLNENVIAWAYPTASAQASRIVIYDHAVDKWSTVDQPVDVLVSVATPFTTIEDLEVIYGDLEDVPGSLDDPQWAGGTFQFGAIDDTHNAGVFTGEPGIASLATGETQIEPGQRQMITYVRPLVEGGTTRVSVGVRNRIQDPIVWTPYVSESGEGLCPVRIEGRYLRARFEITGAFEHAIGFEPYGNPTGRR